jgi:hypothetical protein
MSHEIMTQAELSKLLLSADSPRKYFPVDLDIAGEIAKAQSLAREIASATQLETVIEDPSMFQDGSLFTQIILKRNRSDQAGTVLLSSFGHLATMNEVCEPAASKVTSALRAHGYAYVPIESLDLVYSGKYEAFRGNTWLSRYFSSFYVVDQD